MENQNNKIFTYLLAIFFAVFVGSGIFLLMNNKKATSNEQAVSTATIKQENLIIPTAVPRRGEIKLVLKKEEEPVSLDINPYLNLGLVADSDGENITAFDIIIDYDPNSFDFIRAVSLNPNFKVYPYEASNHLTLTVVKTADNSVETVLTGEEFASLGFQPKVKGNFSFAVLSISGKETTKFVNEKTEVVYPALNEIKITIN